jgi:hypothetical protein
MVPFNGPWASIAWGPYIQRTEKEKDFMIAKDISSKKTEKLFAAAGALIVASAAALVLFTTAILPAQTRQKEVAAKGAKVMPFDLEQTTHVFQKLDDGGLQKVVVKDPSNKKQIALIQSHLKEESEKFRKGDFSDPAKIHGEDMPGLAQLKAGAKKSIFVIRLYRTVRRFATRPRTRSWSRRFINGLRRSFPTTEATLHIIKIIA